MGKIQIDDQGDLYVESPLLQVLEFENLVPNLTEPAVNQDRTVAFLDQKAIRIDILGLPGMGKSSLRKSVHRLLSDHGLSTLVIPEAADYAVIRGELTLDNFGDFLDQVYLQAETLARRAATQYPHLIIIKEPSLLQNNAYVAVKKAVRTDPRLQSALQKLYVGLQSGQRDNELEKKILERFAPECLVAVHDQYAPWNCVYIHLSSGDSLSDIRLSRNRQTESGRDQRLITKDVRKLAGYHIAIEQIVNSLRDRENIFNLSPIDPPSAQAKEVYKRLYEKWIR